MHVARKTNQELVVVDSLVWLSVVLLGLAAVLAYRLMTLQERGPFIALCFLLLCVLICWRREVVTFDAVRQEVRWHRRRAFKAADGTVPFAEIKGITIDSQSSDSRGNLTYRLTILTTGSPVPMSDVYAGNWSRYDALRSQIFDFLHIDVSEQSSPGLADETAIRALLMQGRKVDAIQRLRSCQQISLVEATDRVNAIGEKMKTPR
ncbi:MAG TPA: hypothetical protein VGI45_34845 [Terracidiphilus sp.]|jgi:hypothetical protein